MKRRGFEKLGPLSALATTAILTQDANAGAGKTPKTETATPTSSGTFTRKPCSYIQRAIKK